jgi:Ca2+-binding RTX toxin-like protein
MAELFGTEGNDTLRGVLGEDDRILGLGGDDFLRGRDGDDTLRGGLGDDTLQGGAGADIFVYKDGDGSDVIERFEVGVDRLAIRGYGDIDIIDIIQAAEWDGDDLVLRFDSTQPDNKIVIQDLDLSGFTLGDLF